MTDGPTESLRADPVTAALADRYDVPTLERVRSGERFRRLARTVCSQSVSTAAARATRERLFALSAFDDGVTAAASVTD